MGDSLIHPQILLLYNGQYILCMFIIIIIIIILSETGLLKYK